jgi:hypothetical protein
MEGPYNFMSKGSAFAGSSPAATGALYFVMLPSLLFLLLTPGLIMTLPGSKCPSGCGDGTEASKTWFSMRTGLFPIIVHSVLFMVVMAAIYACMQSRIIITA